MAKIKLYNNIFEEKFEEFEIEAGSKILDSIEQRVDKKIYKETLVECYDTETGKTFYAPLEDEASESVVITVNGKSVDKDYSPKENDLVVVAFMPAGDNIGKVLGAIIGFVGGVLLGAGYVALTAVTLGMTAPLGAIIFGGVLGGVIGLMSGYAIGKKIDDMRNQKSKDQKGLKEGSQAPDVRGANNSTLRGNNYPFVMGKHLVTPFIVGDPYTVYSGTRGRDAYIRMMVCVGYAPLKLTDFKLGEFLLSYNRNHNNISQNTMMSGLLKGYSSGGVADNGDILDLWKNNDIELEIIQQAPGQALDRGTIYPEAIDDQQIDANVLFIADKAITDTAPVTYKGVSFPNNFRTNGVFFTDSCPCSFTITLDFPNGLYSSYTKTDDNTSEALYGDIPLWMCIQWRPYNKNNKSSDPNGGDYSSWNNINFGYAQTFTNDAAKADVLAHRGNDFAPYYQGKVEEYQYVTRYRYVPGYNTYEPYRSYEKVVTQVESFNPSPIYQSWLGKTLQNFQNLSGGEEGMSQTRVSCTVTLTKEQCKAMISENNPTKSIEIRVIRVSPGYINMTHNVSDEISAYSYSDIVKVSSIVTKTFDEDILRYEDRVETVKVQSDADFQKFCYVAIKAKADASGYIINQLNKLNCIAESFSPYWDLTEKKIMPEGVHKVTNYYGYYIGDSTEDSARCNRSSGANVTERLVTKAQYEKARHDGFNWYEDKAGSNYTDIIKSLIFTNRTTHNNRPCYYLNANAAKYNNNCVSSSFLLGCVGAQNGSEACGYEDINILSIADWAESTDALKDGSTFPAATDYRGHHYNRGDEIPVHYEANAYIYQGLKLEEMLSKITVAGRALWIIDETGKIKVIMDKPADYYKGAVSLQDCVQSSNSFSYETLPAGLLIQFADENDGFETNSIYCWTEGNSIKKYHGNVEPYGLDYVTNPYQINSLGLYMLACRVFSKETLTRKIGINGELYSLGDVILVQSNDLLIGETSGRIQELIETNGVIYGFVTDSEYDYTAELDESGNSNQGITVVQPGYMGKSRTVTLPLSDPRSITIDEEVHDGSDVFVIHHTYELKKGRTNVVLIGKVNGSYGIPRTTADPSTTVAEKYDFKTGDVVLFGLIDKIAAPYRIIKIKPEKGGQFTETLIPYDESFYQYGKELPTFQNFITPPPVEVTPFPLTEVPAKLSDQNNQSSENFKKIGFLKDDTPPSPPFDVSIVATEDKISFKWGLFNPSKIKNTVIEYSSDNGDTWEVVGTTAARNWDYYFERNTDGYPEAPAVRLRLYRLKNVSIFDVDSEYVEGNPDTTNYGTWIIPDFKVLTEVVDRTVILTAVYTGTVPSRLYGHNKLSIWISREGNKDIEGNKTFNEILGITPDVDEHDERIWYTPEFSLSVQPSETEETERNYHHYEGGSAKTTAFNTESYKISHTLPLIGQNARLYDEDTLLGFTFDVTNAVVPSITKVTEVPATPIENQIVLYDGTTTSDYEKGKYYIYKKVIVEEQQQMQWQEVPLNFVIKYNGDSTEDYKKGYYYNLHETVIQSQSILIWNELAKKTKMVPTEYYYKVTISNESGSSKTVDNTAVQALCTNIADFVHSHEHYKNLYVEKLSAINANLGMISQGGMGSFEQMMNCWALSDLSPEDSGVPEGVMRGTFRVGDENEYFRVTPYNDPSSPSGRKYKIELKAGNIELSTDVGGETSSMDFTNGTYVYNADKSARMMLSPNGITAQTKTYSEITPVGTENPKVLNWYEQINNVYVLTTDTTVNPQKTYYRMSWTDISKVYADEKGNMIISNADKDKIPAFGYQVDASDTIYHFDDYLNPENEEVGEEETPSNPEEITCAGTVIGKNVKTPPLLDSDFLFSGTITKQLDGNNPFVGNVVFFSKADKVVTSGKGIVVSDSPTKSVSVENAIPLLIGYKEAMKEDSTIDPNMTVGAYLGLNQSQVEQGIF